MAKIDALCNIFDINKSVQEEHNNYFYKLNYDMTKLYNVDVETLWEEMLSPLKEEIDKLISQINYIIDKAKDYKTDFNDEVSSLEYVKSRLTLIDLFDIQNEIRSQSEMVFEDKKKEYIENDGLVNNMIQQIDSNIRDYKYAYGKYMTALNMKNSDTVDQMENNKNINLYKTRTSSLLSTLDNDLKKLKLLNDKNDELINLYFKK